MFITNVLLILIAKSLLAISKVRTFPDSLGTFQELDGY